MKKRRWLALVGSVTVGVMVLGSALTIGFAKPAAPVKPMTLTFDFSYLPLRCYEAVISKWFGDEVEKRTGGLLRFKYTGAGALTKPGEELDALKARVTDGGLIILGFYPKMLYLQQFSFAVPFPSSDTKMAKRILDRLMEEIPALPQEFEKHDAKLLFPSVMDPEALESLMPIRTVEDLKGKKIALSGRWGPRMVEAAGATALNMSTGERATALQTKVIDGSILSLSVTFPIKLYEFAKYCTKVELAGARYGAAVVIRLSLFNQLPRDTQRVILEVSKEAGERYIEGMIKRRLEIEGKMKEAGVTFYDFPFSEKVKWSNMLPDFPSQWVLEGEASGLPTRKIMQRFLELTKTEGYKFPRDWVIK
jgi:TRAP-type C4-dicarboxylate transport system substrate-binding protein